LTLAISYATKAHLFIKDLNQSPFNIGTRVVLEDFQAEQVAELNLRYGNPLKNQSEVSRLMRLVGGQPFLVRHALDELTAKKISLADFEAQAERDEGIFGDHLRRILMSLAKDSALADVVRAVLRGQPCPSAESFYRLRRAGLVIGGSTADVQARCQLYANFLRRRLL